MKCFYHSADLDGHCSGAITKHSLGLKDEEMFPINYGDQFPWGQIDPGEIVYMLDFCLQPWDDMLRLNQACSTLVWIDHHQVINTPEAEEILGHNFRQIGKAGCELAWEFFCPDLPTPSVVHYLGRYDVWDHSNPNTLPFQYGLRLKDTWPVDKNMELWRDLFDDNDKIIDNLIEAGKTVLEYETQQNSKFCKAYAFETELREPVGSIGSVFRIPAIAANRGFTNSKLFDSIWNPDKCDLMISFIRLPLPKVKWTVSLYSTKPEVDCAEIAKKFGGGGHKGAAGFQCDELPFDY